ncbi:uncharacterized protein CTRU02_209047 [Colletotrichum truncatum]|uniref:Uncharacterized protein n=1 Tax=Colletotrichum truncatum TaxID=5467 RepID=A0ACC3YZD8_COLTU|nr:uncharacterized protein CTRU02_07763 [Colletotrichum truncatum]KAF6790856.1 hypothetical protein CTRU02_07763 [Colletotrichum truncatum]
MPLFPTVTSVHTERITPPPDCRILPKSTFDYRSSCSNIYAWNWNGCPSGYTSAHSFVSSRDWNYVYKTLWLTGTDGSVTIASRATPWTTAYVNLFCCPDVLEYSQMYGGGDCEARLSTERVLVYSPTLPNKPPTTTTLTPSQQNMAYAVTASFARVSSGSLAFNARDDSGDALTVWCRASSCRDVPSGLTTEAAAAATATEAPFVLRPPTEMGKLGLMGIVAVAMLLAPLLFGALLLAPWIRSYRQRRRAQQVQSQ